MYRYIGLLVAFTAFINCGSSEVTVTVSPGNTAYLQPADSLSLQCLLNQKIQFIVTGKISWYFKSADPSQTEVKLTEQGVLLVDKTTSQYEFTLDTDSFLNAKLRIKQASDEHTGEYICKAGSAVGSVQVIVVKNVNEVELKIDNFGPITQEEIDPYEAEFQNKKTNIECSAYGSYPEAKVQLFLGDEEIVPDSELNHKALGTSFQSTITARKILYPKHSGKKLRCVGNVNLPLGVPITLPERVSSIPLHIITLVPLITCSNRTASIRDKYVKLECDVSSEKPVRQIFWKLGYNNQIIFPGNKTEDFTEVTVHEIEGNEKNKKVILDIYKMKSEHFNSVFYLIVEDSNGEIYQEPVYIREYHSSSNMLQFSTLTLLVLAISEIVMCW